MRQLVNSNTGRAVGYNGDPSLGLILELLKELPHSHVFILGSRVYIFHKLGKLIG